MKALVLEQYGELVYRDAPDPVPAEGEILVRVKACAICGSDVHGMDGSTGRRIPPLIMGHEASGVVEQATAASDFAVGEPVTFDSTVYCGDCTYCRTGRVNLCDNRRVLGVSCQDYRRNGAMAELVAVPERILYALPEGMSFVSGALVEPLSIAVHAVSRTPLGLGDTCVVVGAGNIGLLIVQVLRARGAGRIIVVDPVETRRTQAIELGADNAVGPEEATAAWVADLTGGLGADRVFEAVGSRTTLTLALRTTRKGASVTLVGNLAPEVVFAQQEAVTREIDLYGSCASSGEYPACLELIRRGQVNVDALVGQVVPLADGARWFQRLHAGEPGLGKVVLTP
jgi:threonine dehydrogenase-like Zn-dependent dehydrogenase